MSPKLRRLLAEQAKRQKQNNVDWLTPDFPAQNNFILDKSPFKVAQTTRRAGKSYGCGIMLFKAAIENPGSSVLYVSKTRGSAKRIMFKDVLGKINREKNLNARTNESELTFTLPNGSIIYLLGIDNSPEEADKLLGQKFSLVVIDEAAFITRDLEKIVYEHLAPAVADYNGQIAMISTTSDFVGCFFYKVTMENLGQWSLHKWTAYENPYMKEQWEKQIKQLTQSNRNIENDPGFQRMYLNRWVVSEESRVYRYTNNNIVDSGPEKKLEYVLGVDLGWNDDSAFTITGFDSESGIVYIVDTFKKPHMTLSEVAEKVLEFQRRYKIREVVIDGAAKQSIEDMRARYNINFKAAEKVQKKDFIEILNSEYLLGRVKLVESTTVALREEMDNLVWDETKRLKRKWVEHANCPNHLCDSTLYAWRYSYSYLKDDPKPSYIDPTSFEAVEKFYEQEAEKINWRQSDDYEWLEDSEF